MHKCTPDPHQTPDLECTSAPPTPTRPRTSNLSVNKSQVHPRRTIVVGVGPGHTSTGATWIS